MIEPVQIGNSTLFLADSLTILPQLGKVDAILTDPPYGTGWIKGGGKRQGDFTAKQEQPDWDEWDSRWLDMIQFDTLACFCPDKRVASLAARFPDHRLRYYVKSNPRPPLGGNDAPSVEPIFIWPRVRYSTGTAHRVAYNGDAEHPCQKPLPIMKWLVHDLTKPGDLVVDPYMGSGSSGAACAMLGRRFIGIESDPGYFKIACRRIEEAYRQGDLFLGGAA